MEEVEVQGLLDALLAFDAEELLGLVRVGGNPGARHPGLALEVPVLGVQVQDLVVYGLGDGSAHGGEGFVVVLHQDVVLAGVVHQVVPLNEFVVVFCDTAFDGGVVDAHVGRKRLVLAAFVDDGVLDIAGHVELVAQVLHLLVDGCALAHVHLGCGIDVRDHVCRLVGGDIGVHACKLILNHLEPVVDEDRGGGCDLVLVENPFLVIDSDEGAQHILAPLGGNVVYAKVDDVGLLVAQGYAKASSIGTSCSFLAILKDNNVLVVLSARRIVVGFCDNNRTCSRYQCVAEIGHEGLVLDLLAFNYEILETDLAVFHEFHGEASGGHVVQSDELGVDWETGAIEYIVVALALDLVVHVQFEPVHYFGHEVRGLECVKFVVDIGPGHEHSHVAELVGVVVGTSLGVGLDLHLGGGMIDRDGRDDLVGSDQEADC